MKELSIEEKAKAYDEIIKNANKMHCENCEACQICIEELIPELKESEDERIRKSLINYVYYHGDAGDFTKEEFIAYLKKQGEPLDKIAQRARTEKQRVLLTETNGDANIDWDTRSLRDVKLLLEYGLDYIKKLEKQGEQKPAWSEEDKKMLDRLLKHFEWTGKYRFDKKDCDEARNWLKSLKDRGVPQLKQEWNEEDEDAIAEAIIALEDMYDPDEPERCYAGYTLTFDKAAERLKSLRHQNRWKPSDEQMKALERAQAELCITEYNKPICDLIDALNKLK